MKMHPGKLWLTVLVICGLAVAAPAQSPPTTSGGAGMVLLNLDNTVAEARFMSDPPRVVYEARQHYFNIASKQRSTY